MRTVTIHQPQYLPWVPYFAKILKSEYFVILDHVQFQKNGLQNRNQIKTPAGAQWLTLPVKHDFGQSINRTEVADKKTLSKHIKTLEQNYRKAPFFDEVMEIIRPIFEKNYDLLAHTNVALLHAFLKYLNYEGHIVRSSDLQVSGEGSELILNICMRLEAQEYLSGAGGKNYLTLEDFEKSGISVLFQKYISVPYRQLHPEAGFIENLSAIDLFFNEGKNSREIIEKGWVQ